MKDVELYFEDNVKEVESYFGFLHKVLEVDAEVCLPNSKLGRSHRIEPDTQKTLKAAALLLLYNLVEATLKRSVPKIYEAIGDEGLSYQQLSNEFGAIWIRDRTKHLATGPVSIEKVRLAVSEIVAEIASAASVYIDSNAFKVSGNLDARKIRQIAKEHGFQEEVNPKNGQGESLLIVKEKRNDLAHGVITFEKCGREFTISDLELIKSDVIAFMRDVLKSIKKHIDNRQYAV